MKQKELGAHTCKVNIGSAYQKPVRRMTPSEIEWQERLLRKDNTAYLKNVALQVVLGAAVGLTVAAILMNILVR